MATGQDKTDSDKKTKLADPDAKPKSRVRRAPSAATDKPPAVATKPSAKQPGAAGNRPLDASISFIVGFVLLLASLGMVFFAPEPKPVQLATFITTLGIAAALVMNGFLSGTIQITTKWVRAGGPMATFVFVCLFAASVSVPNFGGLLSLFTKRW
jgi:hypothetical protein